MTQKHSERLTYIGEGQGGLRSGNNIEGRSLGPQLVQMMPLNKFRKYTCPWAVTESVLGERSMSWVQAPPGQGALAECARSKCVRGDRGLER